MEDKRILVTGVTGATGRHLVRTLRQEGRGNLMGVSRRPYSDLPLDQYFQVDLTDEQRLGQIVSLLDPDEVYHLAGVNGQSAPGEALRINGTAFENLTASLRGQATRRGRPIRLLTIGSAAEIGPRGAACSPVPESVECEPATEYGVSKWRITRQAVKEPIDGPLQILVARPFNLLGPGLDAKLAIGRFAEQIAEVRRGSRSDIRCGSLHAKRDYLDFRDAVDAYAALMKHGRPGQIYNVCRGESFGMREILDRLMTLAGVRVPVHADEGPLKPGDIPDIFGDPGKLSSATGWRPRWSLEQSLKDMLAMEDAP
ncbi:MAG: NAD-dependent epimerase/dehydratase family protein [Planctomycetota bacterium]